jgi:hypothetical protein
MKTTLEIPDAIYRQIKASAALKGQSVRAFFLDAIHDKLAAEREQTRENSGWRSVFGKANADDTARAQKAVDEEFSRIDSEDWE